MTTIKDNEDITPIPAVRDGEVKISVIMPIYNAGEYLEQAIRGVLDQTLRELEIICVDDGSTDNSLEILKRLQKSDERVRIVTETNAGPGIARNNGIKRARGEYMAFLDADDMFEPSMLESLYNEARKNKLDIALCDYDVYITKKKELVSAVPCEHSDIFTAGGIVSKNNYPDRIFLATNGAAWNKLFESAFVREKMLSFLPDVKIYEDVYFVICALSLAERVGKVCEILMHHRVHSEQARARSFHNHFLKAPEVYLKIKEFLVHNGMYAPLSYSFINMTASRCYKMFNFVSSEDKARLWDVLYTEYAEKLDWTGKGIVDFDDEAVFEFVANVEMYDYKQYKKRCARGLTLQLDRIAPLQKTAEKRKKIRFFIENNVSKKKNKNK